MIHLKKWGRVTVALLLMTTTAFAQKTTFKFDFGSGKVAKGFTGVTAKDVYSDAKGYGFDPATPVTDGNRGGKDLLKSDFVTSEKPFYFSVDVPEGNYKVTVTQPFPLDQ